MTSKQVLLILAGCFAALALLPGCGPRPQEQHLIAPYGQRQVWAVVPLRNESASQYADGFRIADELAVVFEKVQGIDVLPVNRVIQAMDSLELDAVRSREDAIKLREVLGVDGLVVGSVTSYDPYDPMRMGLALDLYAAPGNSEDSSLDIRGLSWAPTSDAAGIDRRTLYRNDQPVTTVSGVFSAASPAVRELLQDFAYGRGTSGNHRHDLRLHTLDMNLYTQFVSHEMGSQLMWAEWQRFVRNHPRPSQDSDAGQPAP